MPERRVKFQLPDGKMADASEVPVVETVERWTEVKLEDGSVLRIKPTVLGITRLEGQYDPEGNPMYAVKAAHTIAIDSVPQSLRRRLQ